MAAAEITVMISGGFSPAYRQLLPEFERTTGIAVATASAASQGTGSNTISAFGVAPPPDPPPPDESDEHLYLI